VPLRTTPTAAVEVVWLPPLHLNMEAEDQAGIIHSLSVNNGSPDLYGMGMQGMTGI